MSTSEKLHTTEADPRLAASLGDIVLQGYNEPVVEVAGWLEADTLGNQQTGDPDSGNMWSWKPYEDAGS